MNLQSVASPNWNRRPQDLRPDLVVIHATAGTNSLGWLKNPTSQVSAHYLIRKDGLVYAMVPEELRAWHAGLSAWMGRRDINNYSLGIELENRNDGVDAYPEAQWAATVELVRAICARWGILADRQHIVAHYDISPGRKTDPRGFDMRGFVAEVAGVQPAPTLRAPTTSAALYRVVADVANVRQGPRTTFPVAGQLRRGQKIQVNALVPGEPVEGEANWAHLASGLGFVSLRLLARV